MNEDQKVLLFNTEIDRMLGIESSHSSGESAEILSAPHETLATASWLASADLQSEIRPRPGLRDRWASRSHALAARSISSSRGFRMRWVWAVLAVGIFIAALFIYRQPVLAAVGRLFGYGYFPEVGFVQLDNARVLLSPVRQDHDGRSLTVLRGLSTSDRTTLWLEYSDEARPVDGAWLETPAGERIDLRYWNWDPNRPNTHGVRLEFQSLPAGITQVTLALPEGWRIPLQWIPASTAGLPSLDVIAPYPTALQETASTMSPQPESPCVTAHGLKVCLNAAQTDSQATRVLLEATSVDGQLTPGGFSPDFVLPNPLTNDLDISLTDDLGNITVLPNAPLEPGQSDGRTILRPLSFPPVSSQARQVTLRVPAFEASATLSEPLALTVDLGADPQPGQTLALDQSLTILGQTVHFSQATLEGDGVSSLRVTLHSDPVHAGDGLLVAGLDLGKPEGIDDLYGSGGVGPQGQIKVYSELIGSVSGKKIGLLTFPIVGARVILLGPFKFTFPAPTPSPVSPTATPLVVGGESFSPQPTPSPLPLDSYRYDGVAIQPGDLLFTVVGEATTDLYAYNPPSSATPQRVATLPGQVYQVYLHLDREGIDYLAGTKVTEDGSTFFRSAQLFTVRFEDTQPHLLAAFPRGPSNNKGTEVTANWSYDGRFAVFQVFNTQPKEGEAPFTISWMDLSCRDSGNCQVKDLSFPDAMEASYPEFSPNDYRIIMSGSSNTRANYGAGILMFELDDDGKPGEMVNLSDSIGIDELAPHWNLKTDEVVALCPTDPSEAQRQFCFYDPVTKLRQMGTALDQHLLDYQIQTDGNLLLGIDINHKAADNSKLLEFRMFDWNGHSGPVLATAPLVYQFEGSPNGKYFAYIVDEISELHLVSITQGEEISLPELGQSSDVTWLGWTH